MSYKRKTKKKQQQNRNLSGVNWVIRILKASYIAIEQLFVAKIPYFIFLSLKDSSSYPLGSHFLGITILQVAMTKLFHFLYDNLTAIRCMYKRKGKIGSRKKTGKP